MGDPRRARSIPRSRPARVGTTLAASAVLAAAAAPAARAVNTVTTANGAAWQVHDAASPALDTGSIRAITGNAFYGFGGIKVRVGGVPESDPTARFNGETVRGFGLEFDGVDGFGTTHAVRLGGVQISRAIRVSTPGNWVRWFDSFRNTTDHDVTVEVAFGGTAGLNTVTGGVSNQSQVVASSSGDATIGANDAWVQVANSTAAGPATRGPHAVVLGTPSPYAGTAFGTGNHQRNPFANPLPTTGLEANFHGYKHTLTIPAGETLSLLRFVVAGRAEAPATAGTQIAAVRTGAETLAAAPALDGLSTGERCSVVNWDVTTVPGFDAAACASAKAPEIHPPVKPASPVTTSPYDVVDKSVTELLADMASGVTTSQEITRAYLDRIAAYDGGPFGFHAYITVARDAMAQAKAADEARAKGSKRPLLGVPVSIKDLFDAKDMPTTDGTLALKDWRPKKNAFQVARLRAAGAVILGKSNLSEFANSGSYSESGFGMTANAFRPSKTPLGSSGGPAVSTALSMVGFAMGTQTGVSLDAPATGASLVSMRGTDGISSGSGVMPLTYLQDFEGPIARTTSDVAHVLNVTTGTDPTDPSTVHADADAKRPADWTTALDPGALRGKRIGYLTSAFDAPTTYGQDDGTIEAMKARLADLEAAGATLVPIADAAPSQSTTVAGGFAGRSRTEEGWQSYWEEHEDPPFTTAAGILSSPKNLPYNRGTQAPAPRLTTEDVDKIMAARDEAKARWRTFMDAQTVDALVYPGFRSDVYDNDGAQTLSSDRGTGVPTSNVGLPTIIVPVGANPHGDPMSFQIVGRAFDDAKVLAFGHALEQQLGGKGHLLSPHAPALRYDPDATPVKVQVPTPPAPVTDAPFEPPTEAATPAAPGGAGVPTTPATPATPSPAARRTVRTSTRTARLDGRGRFAIRVSCAEGASSCRVRVLVRRGNTGVASRTLTIRPGRTATLRARPTAAMRRTLLRGRPVTVKVSFSGAAVRPARPVNVVVRPR